MTLHEALIHQLRLNIDNPNNMMYLPYPIIRDMQEAADVIEEMDAEYESMAAALLEADELIKKLQSERDDLVEKEREAGTWKLAFTEDENVYECSKCGKHWLLNDGDPYDNEMNFCPRCGTPMVASTKTCGDCYWYSDITVHVCEREKEPTSADQAACPMFEPKEEATPRHLDAQDLVEEVSKHGIIH